jgi:hypothetical protein
MTPLCIAHGSALILIIVINIAVTYKFQLSYLIINKDEKLNEESRSSVTSSELQ